MKLRFFTLFLSLFTFLVTFAQSDDFGFDFSLRADKKLRPGTHLFIDGGVRTMDHTKKVDRWSVGLGLSQRLYTNGTFELKTGLKWEYMWVNAPEQTKDKTEEHKIEHWGIDENEEEYSYTTDDYYGYNHRYQCWRGRHRTTLSLGASYNPNKRWSFSLREAVQYSHYNRTTTRIDRYLIDEVEEDDDGNIIGYTYTEDADHTKVFRAKDKFLLRTKLGVDYNIRHCPIDPYVSAEYGCGLNYKGNKWKFTAGTDIKIGKQHKIDLFYRYQTEDDDDDPNGHIIGLGYNFKF